MRCKIYSIICILLYGVMAVVEADVYYVSMSGSNSNPGTEAEPWETLSYALENAGSPVTAGDSIIIRAGTYIEGTITPITTGTEANLIVIKNYDGEVVILDSSNFFFSEGINCYVLDSLSIRNSSGSGIKVAYSTQTPRPDPSFTFTNCTVSLNKYMGFNLFGGWGGIIIRSCNIDSNGMWNGVQTGVNGTGINMYGSDVATGRIEVKACSIRYNWPKGMSHASGTNWDCDSSFIDSNYVWDNFESGIDWWADSSYMRGNYLAWNGHRDTEAGEFGDKGLSLDDLSSGMIVAYNLIRKSGRYELSARGAGNYYYNNTFIHDHYYTVVAGSPMSATVIRYADNGDDNVFKNNIFVNLLSQDDHQWILTCAAFGRYIEQDWDHNCYWSEYASGEPITDKPFYISGAQPSTYCWFTNLQGFSGTYAPYDSSSFYEDPLFADYADSNFNLSANSGCVDGGIADSLWLTLGYSYQGSAPDMGAYETNNGNIPPQINPPLFDFITDEDRTLVYDLTPHEYDPEQPGEELTWSISGLDPVLAAGNIEISTDILTITPVENEFGSDGFTLTLSDGQGGLANQEVDLIINSINDPPNIDPVVPDIWTQEDHTFSDDLTKYETDIEDMGEALYWTASGANPELMSVSIDPITDIFSITPVLNANGEDTLVLTLHDSEGGTDFQDWIVTVQAVNDTPWIAPPIPDQRVMAYYPYTLPLVGYGHDIENSSEELNWEVDNVDPALFSATIDPVTKVLTMYPVMGTAGIDEIIISLGDSNNAVVSQDVIFDLFPGGIPPAPPQVSELPDLQQSPGVSPEPIDLQNYIEIGAVQLPNLTSSVDVWSLGSQGGSTLDLIVYIEEWYLHIEAPTPDWLGTRMVAVHIEDTYGSYDEDTLMVNFSTKQFGYNLPQPDNLESWYIAEQNQTVHEEEFTLHIMGFQEPSGFVTFQKNGGKIQSWVNVSGIEKFTFPLTANAENLLQLRISYEDEQYGIPQSVTITEDSTPPAPPVGLSLVQEKEENAQTSIGSD